jgi:hypothetical protein
VKGDFFMPKDFTEWTRPSSHEGRVCSQHIRLSIIPTLLLAERLLVRPVPEIGKAQTEPNHNQRV